LASNLLAFQSAPAFEPGINSLFLAKPVLFLPIEVLQRLMRTGLWVKRRVVRG
jgi:hypothetical protein